MDDLLGEFIAETAEGLSSLDEQLLVLEETPDDQARLRSIFRAVHTIKGTCGFFDLRRLEALTHSCEDVLGKLRDGKLEPTADAIRLLFKVSDRIRTIVSALEKNGSEPAGDDLDLIEILNARSNTAPAEAEPVEVTKLFAETDSPAEPDAPIQAEMAASVEHAADPAIVAENDEPQQKKESVDSPTDIQAASTIRVHVDLLESLMTTVSELVLTRNQVLQIMRSETESAFSGPLQRLSQLTSELQTGILKTRMQPIRNSWSTLPRLVRDVARELGKEVNLTLHGADTELDRQVMELLKDPLIHMVRNSVDHGIELPSARLAAGKPEAGAISLSARHDGNFIVIEVADDGRGLDTAGIRRKILEKRLAAPAELARMSDEEVNQFIFKPGFSTAAEITNISGRGVGMDVVISNIERIGGTLDLWSQPGRGSKVTLKIPLTLAIVAALIVESGGERFAIPQSCVEELVLPSGRTDVRVESVNEKPLLRLREKLLPLIPLGRLLKIDETSAVTDDSHVVVVRVGNKAFGIVVDDIHDTEEIVVKPMTRLLRHIAVYSGTTILGDGTVITILDPSGIAAALNATAAAENKVIDTKPGAEIAASGKQSFFVFRAGAGSLKAAPLEQVTRLEELDCDRIEYANGQAVIQYRGGLMPVMLADPSMTLERQGLRPLLVFADEDRSMGLLIDEIVDIFEDEIAIRLETNRPGLLGGAVIGGRITDLIDTGHYLTQAYGDWFPAAAQRQSSKARREAA